jgi:hypothetical protein
MFAPRLPNDYQALNNPQAERDLAIDDLCKRELEWHLLDTCGDRSQFAKEEFNLWRKRALAHGCVETVASLVLQHVLYHDVDFKLEHAFTYSLPSSYSRQCVSGFACPNIA